MSEAETKDYAKITGSAFPWHEVYTQDLDATVEFYTKALGLGVEKMPMGEMGDYTMLSVNGNAVAGVVDTTTLPMPGVPPHWAVYLAVDDVDARLKSVLENGGKVLVEAMDIPTVGRMGLIQDPTGATIWLYKSAPTS